MKTTLTIIALMMNLTLTAPLWAQGTYYPFSSLEEVKQEARNKLKQVKPGATAADQAIVDQEIDGGTLTPTTVNNLVNFKKWVEKYVK